MLSPIEVDFRSNNSKTRLISSTCDVCCMGPRTMLSAEGDAFSFIDLYHGDALPTAGDAPRDCRTGQSPLGSHHPSLRRCRAASFTSRQRCCRAAHPTSLFNPVDHRLAGRNMLRCGEALRRAAEDVLVVGIFSMPATRFCVVRSGPAFSIAFTVKSMITWPSAA